MVHYSNRDIEMFRAIVKDNPSNSEMWFLLGLALLENAQGKEAKHAFEKSAESPEHAIRLVGLAEEYIKTDRYNDAEMLLRIVLGTHFNDADVLKDFALVLWLQNRHQEAEDALRLALVYLHNEFDTWTHCFLADILAETGRGAEALAFYLRASSIDNQNYDAWVGIGKFFINRQKYAEAEKPFKMAVRLNPDDISSLISLGIVQYELKKYEKAAQTLRSVLAQDSTNARALYLLGKTLYMLEKTEDAEKVLGKAKRAWRKLDQFDASRAWTNLGRFYADIDSYNRAQKALSKAIALYPTREEPHNVLESLYQKMNRVEDAYKERMIIESLESEIEDIDEIPYDDIDASIHEVIRQFNDLGLITTESCSGLKEDHVGRKSDYSPFLIINLDSPSLYHHLITIADMVGWKAECSGTEITLSLEDYHQVEVKKRWNLLLASVDIVIKSISQAAHIED